MQKDASGNRTDAEQKLFKKGLGVMSSLYASLLGTAVVVQSHVPARPLDLADDEVWNATPYEQRGWVRSITHQLRDSARAHHSWPSVHLFDSCFGVDNF